MKSVNDSVLNRGGQYESPAVYVVDIHSEGVLCASPADYNDPAIGYDPWIDMGEI